MDETGAESGLWEYVQKVAAGGKRWRSHDLQISIDVEMHDSQTHGHDSDRRHGSLRIILIDVS